MKQQKWLIVLLTLLAFGLRVWRLEQSPPGFRDDELINLLVISQKALDGDWSLFYPDASGHEGLYHWLNAGTLALFGRNIWGIRGLSIYLGTLTIPLLYQMGRKLFDAKVGLLAATTLAVSFWGLMYSRFALRHIGLGVLIMPAFYAFWQMIQHSPQRQPQRHGDTKGKNNVISIPMRLRNQFHSSLIAGICLGLSFYVYFSARGVPLILLTFVAYLWLTDRQLFQQIWHKTLLILGIAAILALPLLLTLRQMPANEGRIVELAVPLVEARAGNFAPLRDHIQITLGMITHTGDTEWLYNIPERPVFGVVGGIFFWLGVIICLRRFLTARQTESTHAGILLLLWGLAGISPAFLSVPPASLSHTILAQPAVYLLVALPITIIPNYPHRKTIQLAVALLLIAGIASRDLPDYFQAWTFRGNTRFLYHADMNNIAQTVQADPTLTDFGVTSLLDGVWAKLALEIALQNNPTESRPRWYNPERALLIEIAGKPALNFNGYPVLPTPYESAYLQPPLAETGGYRLNRVDFMPANPFPAPICFVNGLCATSAQYSASKGELALSWRVVHPLDLPPQQLISNPPPPDVYAGKRLSVFGQLANSSGEFIVGDDGLWVDPYSLQTGDLFQQNHHFSMPANSQPTQIIFGLYDPKDGRRILTENGVDHVVCDLGQVVCGE